jgi:hypothetical protein
MLLFSKKSITNVKIIPNAPIKQSGSLAVGRLSRIMGEKTTRTIEQNSFRILFFLACV